MFYLLENGKIIDSRTSYTVNIPYWEIKDNCLFAKSKNDKLVRPYNKNKIKKQSENVYDLIDWEKDLVRVDDAIHHCKYFHRDLREEYIENKWFNAIYKPDEKGNYIKVWEKHNG